MKKLLTGLLGVLLLALGFYVVWLQFPKLNEPEMAESAYLAADKRLDESLLGAGDPAKNGYLDPELLPYWGRHGIEFQEYSEAEGAVKGWSDYCSAYLGSSVDHEALQKTPEYQKALGEMSHLAPQVRHASEKPLFIPPDAALDFTSTTVNFISLRAIAHALSGLAEARVQQGQFEEAADDLLTVMTLGQRLEEHALLISVMIGITTQTIALDTAIGTMDINQTLPPQVWAKLAEGFIKRAPRKDLLKMTIEGEMTAAHNTMKLYNQGKWQYPELERLRYFPGLISREERIYVNTMTGLLKQASDPNGGGRISSFHQKPTAYDWLSGKAGILSQSMTPNFQRAGEQIRLHRNSALAAATAYGIAAYRAREGRLPSQLDEIRKTDIALTDDAEFLTLVQYELSDQGATLKVRVSDHRTDLFIPSGQYWENPWFETDQEFVTYRFE